MGRHRTAALVVGILLLLPGLGLLAGSGGLGLARLAGGGDGYLSRTLDPVRTGSAAVVSSDLGVVVDAGVPRGLLDRLELRVRLRATPLDGSGPLFVGIGPSDEVDRYLAGATHDRLTRVDGTRPVLEVVPGPGAALPAPASQPFWVASTRGPGPAQVDWQPTAGTYSVVVMSADGQPGVRAATVVAVSTGFLVPLAVVLLVLGALLTTGGVLLLVRSTRRVGPGGGPGGGTGPGWTSPPDPAHHSAAHRR